MACGRFPNRATLRANPVCRYEAARSDGADRTRKMPSLPTLMASRARVWWKCQECGASGPVDVDRVIAAKGPDYDLTDRTAACPAEGCTYWVSFYARQGMRNTPLRTEAGMLREMDRRTEWLRNVGRIGKARPGEPERASTPQGRG